MGKKNYYENNFSYFVWYVEHYAYREWDDDNDNDNGNDKANDKDDDWKTKTKTKYLSLSHALNCIINYATTNGSTKSTKR